MHTSVDADVLMWESLWLLINDIRLYIFYNKRRSMQEVIKALASIFFLYCSKNFLNKRKKIIFHLAYIPRTQESYSLFNGHFWQEWKVST